MIKSGPTGSFRGYLNIRAGPPTEKLNFCAVGKFPKCRLLILASRKINIKCSSQIFIILQPYVDPCWSVSFSSHMLIRASHSASAQKWPAGSTTGVTCVSSSNFSVTMMTMMVMMVINWFEMETMTMLMIIWTGLSVFDFLKENNYHPYPLEQVPG